MTPFDVWAPIFRAPFSGNVTQEIAPQLFSPEIKGVPEIEHKIQTEVASFGKQLGKVLEALETLSKATKTPLPEITQLIEDIEAAKVESTDALEAHASQALARLRRADEGKWKALMAAD